MKEAYGEPIRFQKASAELIVKCDDIVNDYVAQGYRLTIRQLYYQLVARGLVPNTMQSYANVQNLMTKARMAGLIDWDAIEDRTRGFIDRAAWKSGSDILNVCAKQYHQDLWARQDSRVFVVVEKEALTGVLEGLCHELDVPLLAARGYPSASTMREFAKTRIMGATRQIVVLHLGDHDPSGIDMTRDLIDRLTTFTRHRVPIDFQRIALTMEQIEEQQPPPNPAKTTDARFEAYSAQFGDESWELDALSPQYLNDLVREHVTQYIDEDELQITKNEIAEVRARIATIAKDFDKK